VRGTNDTQILLGIVVFLGTLAFVSATFETQILTTQSGWNASYSAGNETVVGEGTALISAPPVCQVYVGGWLPFLGDLIDGVACLGGYVIWLGSLMFITSEVNWLYTLIILPCIIAIGIIIVRLVRSGGG